MPNYIMATSVSIGLTDQAVISSRKLFFGIKNNLIKTRAWLAEKFKLFIKSVYWDDIKFFFTYGFLINFVLAVIGRMRFGLFEIFACGIAYYFLRYELTFIMGLIIRGK
jgi:hypothetical protein